MKAEPSGIRLAATDLSNHLACCHLTSLELSVARGQRHAPQWRSPDLRVIQELGLRHEAAYLKFLADSGVSIENLGSVENEQQSLAATRSCMESGAEAIAQGSLAAGRWFGRPDLLRKVSKPSRLGTWSYEPYDCKLSRETKAATILQLGVYSALLQEIQGANPEFMYVVPAGRKFEPEAYRFADYAAYYRHVKQRLEAACDNGRGPQTYPEPCAHCEICRWFRECDARRRQDDHLSLVSGITRLQRNQLISWGAGTMAKLAILRIPLEHKPSHGSKEGYERVREQARVQVLGRTNCEPVHELLAPVPGTGLCKLREPSPRDIFVDLEGDPFAADNGRQYLFGFVGAEQNGLQYAKRWSFTAEQEKQAFEWLVDEIMRRWQEAPGMHVWHFGAHEPSQFKCLMGRYATREDEVDRMLRAGLFIDLHTIFKQAVRASVEEYSLKALEVFYSFARTVPLPESRQAMRYVEHWLELEWGGELPDDVRKTMEAYNQDDCRSAASLRDWLEEQRRKLQEGGTVIPRPALGDGAPSQELDERQKRVAELVQQLSQGIPADPDQRSEDQAARWVLAQLLDWHRRENKAAWWEGYRLAELDDEELLDERVALSGLRFPAASGF